MLVPKTSTELEVPGMHRDRFNVCHVLWERHQEILQVGMQQRFLSRCQSSHLDVGGGKFTTTSQLPSEFSSFYYINMQGPGQKLYD